MLGTSVCDVACGRFHTLLRTTKGYVYSYGLNSDGQTGIRAANYVLAPKKLDLSQANQIFAGWDQSFVLCGKKNEVQ